MIEPVTADVFWGWAESVGLGLDPRYPEVPCLGLLPPRESARFWVLSGDPGTWPHLVGSILKGLDRWETGYLWPRGGGWPRAVDSTSYQEQVRDLVFRGAGVPDGWTGAMRYARSERAAVLAILFVSLSFAWCAGDDLYFVPDHGRQVVQTDHHDVIHVECLEEDRMLKLVQYMEEAGYPLPLEPPDETFRWPHWMSPKAE